MRAFVIRLARRSASEFLDDHCTQQAAAITYHVLFSLFPLAIVVAGASSLILHATGSRHSFIDTIVGQLPLSANGASDIRDLLLGATSKSAGLGLLGIIGLVYSASGMMASLRTALNRAWDVEEARPFLRGKLIDIALVAVAAAAGLTSLGLTIAARLIGAGSGIGGWLGSLLVPGAFAFALLVFLYRVVPAAEVRLANVWPAALLVAVLLVALQNLFAVYVANFAHYNAVYGSLGAVIAFMFFVYLGAQLVLFGAEVASEVPRVGLELARERRAADDSPPVGRRRSAVAVLRQGLARLWRRPRGGHNWPNARPRRH
ncbi:MAG TPA: YihY/virulence factor BrkB family protein [Solirubrobacteraceae bacterium]|nr:YihY/virulence factor BrkB family protein [Solirubrobacteraceae bacterium]